MNSNITINWVDKDEVRGLTETAIEKMRSLADKIKKPNLVTEAEKTRKRL